MRRRQSQSRRRLLERDRISSHDVRWNPSRWQAPRAASAGTNTARTSTHWRSGKLVRRRALRSMLRARSIGVPAQPTSCAPRRYGEIPKAATLARGAAERVRPRLFQGRLCRTRFQGRSAAADGLVRLTDGSSSLGGQRHSLFSFELLITVVSRDTLCQEQRACDVWIKIGLGRTAARQAQSLIGPPPSGCASPRGEIPHWVGGRNKQTSYQWGLRKTSSNDGSCNSVLGW